MQSKHVSTGTQGTKSRAELEEEEEEEEEEAIASCRGAMRPTPPAQRAPGTRSTHEGQRTALSGAAWRRALRVLMLMLNRTALMSRVQYAHKARRPPARPPDIIVNKRAARCGALRASARELQALQSLGSRQSALHTRHAPTAAMDRVS